MKGLSKWHISFVPFFILFGILSASLLNVYSVFADPDPYSNPTMTDNIYLGGDDSVCPKVSIGGLGDFATTNTSNDYSYKNSWNYQNNYPSGQVEAADSFFSDLNSLLSSGATSGWGITQQSIAEAYNVDSSHFSDNLEITIYLFDPADNFSVSDNGLHNDSHSMRYATFFLNPNNGCHLTGGVSDNLWTIPFQTSKLFYMSTDNITYPDGYTGQEIPSSPKQKIQIIPDFTYLIEDRTIKMTPINSIYTQLLKNGIPLYPNDGYLTYFLEECTDATYLDCENVNSQENVIESQSYSFTVTDRGYYKVLAYYSFPSPVPPPVPPEGTLLEYPPFQFNWDINGSTFSGNSNGQDCTATFCPAQSQYEDCSVYGADIIGGFGCTMRNFGTWIVDTITTLFVPSQASLRSIYSDLGTRLHEKFGFLYYPVDFFTSLFNTMGSASNNCNPDITSGVSGSNFSGHFFGSPVTLNPCSTETQFPSIYNFVATIVRILVVAGLVFAVFRKLREKLSGTDAVGVES